MASAFPGHSVVCRRKRAFPRRQSLRHVLFTLGLSVFTAVCMAQAQRGLVDADPLQQPQTSASSYYALVIGIDRYHPPMKELKTAVNDAQAVGKLLEDRYNFHVQYLLDADATRFNILNALAKLRMSLNENDNLLIYYAGHGYSDRDAEKAYWLPIDADSANSPNRIIADDLTTGVRVLPSRHVLIISDSCYSGALTRDADAPVRSDGQTAFLARMLRSRSRTLMASGGDEPVSDSGTNGHSVFAYAVLRALQGENDAMFTASDLFYGSVRQQVAGKSEQLPQYSIIRNSDHDEGDFVFTRAIVHAPAPPTNAALTPLDAFNRGEAFERDRRYADAAPLLKAACEGGNASGCTDLGWMYQSGLGVNRNDAQGVVLFRRSCDLGNMRGCFDLGSMHETGRGVGKDEEEAVSLYRKSCDGADAMACKNLGDMYLNGRGVGKDDQQAAANFRKACDLSDPAGCTSLGLAYLNGKGIEKDPLHAASVYRKACDGGDPNGCNNLGGLYMDGQGVSKDEAQAAALALKACDGGYAIGCSNLAWMYQNGRGVTRDDVAAVSFLRKSCDGNNPAGCNGLGIAMANGKGIAKDDAQAATAYRKACDGGDAQGCNNIGASYATGTGVPKDDVQAFQFTRKACDAGNPRGCNNLGRLYENGKGTAKNTAQAEELYHTACERGFEEGCNNLKRLKP